MLLVVVGSLTSKADNPSNPLRECSARPQPAKFTQDDWDSLLRQGYYFVTPVRVSFGDSRKSSLAKARQMLPTAAAKNGGDLVRVTQEPIITNVFVQTHTGPTTQARNEAVVQPGGGYQWQNVQRQVWVTTPGSWCSGVVCEGEAWRYNPQGAYYWAARYGKTDIMEQLVARGAAVNGKDDFGLTALHGASSSGETRIVESLLASKVDVNAKSIEGKSPLHFAAQNRHKDVVGLLLANHAEVNARDNKGGTPLLCAVGDTEKERLLIQIQVNRAIRNTEMEAVSRMNLNKYLVEKGSVIETRKDIVEFLLANKAEVNARSNDGTTPLHWAAAHGPKGLVELLLANKAEVNARSNDGTTPLHWAAAHDQTDLVEFLLANKAEVNARSNDGTTPLHKAAWWGFSNVVEVLLANKADVNAKNNDGNTPLKVAAKLGRKDIEELLRQHGGQK
jgi:ankyrin repeat protein